MTGYRLHDQMLSLIEYTGFPRNLSWPLSISFDALQYRITSSSPDPLHSLRCLRSLFLSGRYVRNEGLFQTESSYFRMTKHIADVKLLVRKFLHAHIYAPRFHSPHRHCSYYPHSSA
jgi:hypothetical protein